MTIAAILAGRPQTIIRCSPDTSVGDAARLLADRRIGAMPVLADADDGGVLGIFSERDLLYCLAERGTAVLEHPVSAVMTTPVISVRRDVSVLQALALMTERRIRHLPVLQANDGERPQLVAFLSIGDLVKHRLEKMEREAQDMRDYITSA